MTTWLREMVERRARRTNPSFSLSLFHQKKQFIYILTNRKPSTGILATCCRLTTTSSILDIQLLPMIFIVAPWYHRGSLLTRTNSGYHPVSMYFYRSNIYQYLPNTLGLYTVSHISIFILYFQPMLFF